MDLMAGEEDCVSPAETSSPPVAPPTVPVVVGNKKRSRKRQRNTEDPSDDFIAKVLHVVSNLPELVARLTQIPAPQSGHQSPAYHPSNPPNLPCSTLPSHLVPPPAARPATNVVQARPKGGPRFGKFAHASAHHPNGNANSQQPPVISPIAVPSPQAFPVGQSPPQPTGNTHVFFADKPPREIVTPPRHPSPGWGWFPGVLPRDPRLRSAAWVCKS